MSMDIKQKVREVLVKKEKMDESGTFRPKYLILFPNESGFKCVSSYDLTIRPKRDKIS